MKIRFFLCSIAMLLMVPLFAQKPEFEFKLGMNIANWKLGEQSSNIENHARVGLLTGFSAGMEISGAVSGQAELLYGMYGSTFTNSQDEKGN